MMRRVRALVIAALVALLPAASSAQQGEGMVPPAGVASVVVLVSDGMELRPVMIQMLPVLCGPPQG